MFARQKVLSQKSLREFMPRRSDEPSQEMRADFEIAKWDRWAAGVNKQQDRAKIRVEK